MKTTTKQAKTKIPEPTAAEMYTSHRNDIARLLDVMQMELDKHRDGHEADPKNWGRTGDLAKVRRDLIETLSFLSGMEEERIWDFLAE